MLIRIVCLLVIAFSLRADAHLCNDVFVQARDNLAVKVDIRDGQLRINQEASFRVYLLNTMDRDIVDIRLEVISPEFAGVVKPASDWKGFPYLRTSLKGGRKEYFEVTLNRKRGTADGKYTIGLRLFNGQQPGMEFKTVAIADAMAVVPVPHAPRDLRVDGTPGRAEWGDAALLSGFSANVKQDGYVENQRSDCETRVRFSADDRYLYALVTAPVIGDADRVSFFFAADPDAEVRKIGLDLKTGVLSGAPDGAQSAASRDGVEVRIPLDGLDLPRSFLVNIARWREERLSFWRGTGSALDNPVVFARVVLTD